jgi:hypothetical protein
MTIDDSAFHTVPLNTREPHACSPTDPGGNWRGILLRAPSRVVLPAHGASHGVPTLPLCGLYLLNASNVMGQAPMMLVVTDQHSGQVYRGAVVERDSNPEAPPPPSAPLDPAQLATLAIGSHFNLNVATYVELPHRPARYQVLIEFAGQQSNRVDIAVVAPP